VSTNKVSCAIVQLYLDRHLDLLVGNEQNQAILNQVLQYLPIFGDQTHTYDIQAVVQHTTTGPKPIFLSPSRKVGPGMIASRSVFGI